MDKFPRIDLPALLKDVDSFVEQSNTYVDTVTEVAWQPSDGLLGLVYRAILRRQHDAIKTIIELVTLNKGHSATTLLRPACEELIWVEYLKKITPNVAERIVTCKGALEMYENLQAQGNYFTESQMKQMGFSKEFISNFNIAKTNAEKELTEIGKNLSWKLRQGQYTPSMRYLAKQTNHLDTYDYLYHATSRTVHFTVHELYRRVWGSPGSISIRSDHFDKYWALFALYWGWRLYVETLVQIALVLPEEDLESIDAKNWEEVLDRICGFPPVPIMTAIELYWPHADKSI